MKQIIERGYSVQDLSRRLGVSTHSLYGWRKKFGQRRHGSTQSDEQAEIRRLRNELKRVTEKRDIPKKATAHFAKESQRGTPLSAHQDQYPIRTLYNMMGSHRSGYHAW